MFTFDDGFKSVPRSLNFNLPDDLSNISQVQSLLIVENTRFDCHAWEPKISFSHDYFTKTNCKNLDDPNGNAKILDDEDDENGDYENPNTFPKVVTKKKNLSGGAIAGIVIACIVVVAALMIGEFFLVKHLLNKDSAPSENEAENV